MAGRITLVIMAQKEKTIRPNVMIISFFLMMPFSFLIVRNNKEKAVIKTANE